MSGAACDDLLLMQNLSKVYKRGFTKIQAVDQLAVGIAKGEVCTVINSKYLIIIAEQMVISNILIHFCFATITVTIPNIQRFERKLIN